MKKILTLSFYYLFAMSGFAQQVSIVNKKFVVNGNASCPIYFNGANTPWEAWNDFGGSYNSSKWTADLIALKGKGINSTRIWFSCDGNGQPSIASDGTVSAPTAKFWSDCDDLFKNAQANGIYVYATMMSFDHTKPANKNSTNWQNMMNSATKTRTFVDNYLVPFVNRYKTNPYLWAIDLCNEIEWIYENGAGRGDGSNWGGSYAVLQRYVAMCSAGLHQAGVARVDGSSVLVTLGSACVKWNGTKLPNGNKNPDGNKWSDSNLQAQNANNAASYLDFYSPHFYGWMEQTYSSPFEKTPAQYGMDEKVCIVAEMPARDPMPTPSMSLTTAFNNLKSGGWQGHMPWTANITTGLGTEVGDLADFGAAAQTFANNNVALVKPTCTSTCTTAVPTVSTPIIYCQNVTANPLTATGIALKWYTVATGGTSSAASPTPSTTTAGNSVYYVSQTLNNCESPRTAITVTVNASPIVTISSPANNSITTANPANITLTATVNSTVTNVQFYNGTASLAVDVSSPYSYAWNDVSNGSYTLYAKATDSNNCTDTATVKITVNKTITGLEGNGYGTQSNEILYFPNPFTDNLTLESNGQFTYQLYDLTGNKLAEGQATNHISVGQTLPQGIYLLKVSRDGNTLVKKVTKD